MRPVKVVTVGRSPENEIMLNDNMVSRHHCQLIKYDDGRCSVSDMGSANGTFVNGCRISGSHFLNPQDTVTVGNTTLPWQSYLGGGSSAGGGKPPKGGGSNTGLIIGLVVAVLAIAGVVLFLVLGKGKDTSSTTTAKPTYSKTIDREDIPVSKDDPRVRTNVPGATRALVDRETPTASDWYGMWHDESGDFMLEIQSVAYGQVTGGYIYSSFSKTDTGDEEENFMNYVSGTISADMRTAEVTYTSQSWGGTGYVELTLMDNGQMKWRVISRDGTAYVPDCAILTKE